jgi:predicted nucleotidyltransferase
MAGDGAVSVDAARSILNDLIRQRQRMRDSEANASLLEANRLAIAYWQWQLTRALERERGRTPALA